jgi:inosine-uridine nucleoside N-ribohydrolase
LCLAGVYLHDPTTMMAAVDPSLMTYEEGVVRVQQEGICRGMTVFCDTIKRYVLNGELILFHALCKVY